MARKLAKSTLSRLKRKLDQEHQRMTTIIENFVTRCEMRRLVETGSGHNADSENADGGSITFEMEIGPLIEENAKELVERIGHILDRMQRGVYGVCEVSGKSIPMASLDALPHAITRVEFADQV